MNNPPIILTNLSQIPLATGQSTVKKGEQNHSETYMICEREGKAGQRLGTVISRDHGKRAELRIRRSETEFPKVPDFVDNFFYHSVLLC